ncbi:MAG: ribosome silencing factor [Clostridia bacterium]|nr:ribosome silencing factor [Clostridia bacterium]MDD4048414.1 ribosome silencing factor [Clostridia bacterium]
MNNKDIVISVCKAIDDKKGRNIEILELGEVSLIADYFIICSGNSRIQTRAITDKIEDDMKDNGYDISRREGYSEGRWILLDYGFLIVHIFQEEERQFYNLERLWGDAPVTHYPE